MTTSNYGIICYVSGFHYDTKLHSKANRCKINNRPFIELERRFDTSVAALTSEVFLNVLKSCVTSYHRSCFTRLLLYRNNGRAQLLPSVVLQARCLTLLTLNNNSVFFFSYWHHRAQSYIIPFRHGANSIWSLILLLIFPVSRKRCYCFKRIENSLT